MRNWFEFTLLQNNNPKVFTKDARPIVEFSIENLKALNARQKRQQKSVEKNPTLMMKKNKANVVVGNVGNVAAVDVKADKTLSKKPAQVGKSFQSLSWSSFLKNFETENDWQVYLLDQA